MRSSCIFKDLRSTTNCQWIDLFVVNTYTSFSKICLKVVRLQEREKVTFLASKERRKFVVC